MSPKKKAERESRKAALVRHIRDRNRRWWTAIKLAVGIIHDQAIDDAAAKNLPGVFNAMAFEAETGETPELLKGP
jgi:hypothetical protein